MPFSSPSLRIAFHCLRTARPSQSIRKYATDQLQGQGMKSSEKPKSISVNNYNNNCIISAKREQVHRNSVSCHRGSLLSPSIRLGSKIATWSQAMDRRWEPRGFNYFRASSAWTGSWFGAEEFCVRIQSSYGFVGTATIKFWCCAFFFFFFFFASFLNYFNVLK